jgi:hypothetical protein
MVEELRRPLSLPSAVYGAVWDSGSMRSSSNKANMVSAGIGSAAGLRQVRTRAPGSAEPLRLVAHPTV